MEKRQEMLPHLWWAGSSVFWTHSAQPWCSGMVLLLYFGSLTAASLGWEPGGMETTTLTQSRSRLTTAQEASWQVGGEGPWNCTWVGQLFCYCLFSSSLLQALKCWCGFPRLRKRGGSGESIEDPLPLGQARQ